MANKEVSSVRVFARFRPTRTGHTPLTDFNIDKTLNQIRLGERHRFRFDGVLSATSTQDGTYQTIGHTSVTEVLKGYNATVLAYGQTGSGKTHTMLGAGFGEGSAETQAAWDPEGEVAGLMPRVIQNLFRKATEDDRNTSTIIECSMLEIYNEEIRDLLQSQQPQEGKKRSNKKGLRLREIPERGVFVEGLLKQTCKNTGDVLALIQIGSQARSTASTNMNAMSSRSHVVVTITTTQSRMDGSTVRAKLHLVDLAGSERVGKTDAKGSTLKEAQSINQSLSALGNCMRALTTGNSKHIPFRDSKLTHLLRDSLGGNSKTSMVICLASDDENKEETMTSLRFGQRAKRIQCSASVNKSGGGLAELKRAVQLLQNQVTLLESENKLLKQGGGMKGEQQGEQKDGNNNTNMESTSATLQAKSSECEALRLQLDSAQHTLKERDATVVTLEFAKQEVQTYSETLLAQLNEVENRQTAAASMIASNDEQVEAAREAVASEEERLRLWESELHATRELRQQQHDKKVLDLELRNKELDEREKVLLIGNTGGTSDGTGDETNGGGSTALQEQFEEKLSMKMAELEAKAKLTEERILAKEKEITQERVQLRQAQRRTEEKSKQLQQREIEFDEVIKNGSKTDDDRLKEMSIRMDELETYKKTKEREKAALLVSSTQQSRKMKELKDRTTNQEARIKDLEDQILSLYYAHQKQKEFEAEEIQENQKREQHRKDQMAKDAALAKMYQDRGSSGLERPAHNNSDVPIVASVVELPSPSSSYTTLQEHKRSSPSPSPSQSPPPPPPRSTNPFEHLPLPPSHPEPQPPSRQLTDHELALQLHQEERTAMENRRRSQQQYGSEYGTPNSTRSTPSTHSSSGSFHRTPHSGQRSNMSSTPSSTSSSPAPQSPFQQMQAGQSVVLNSTPAMFHRCKVKLGMMGVKHPRYLIINQQSLVVMKPNKDLKDTMHTGTACIFKSINSLHGVRARINMKHASHVDVVDPDGRTTYCFDTEEKAQAFVRDVELHLP